MIVVVSSSGKVFRQWRGCDSDNGRNLVAATAIGLVDSPLVELFGVAEYIVLLLEILLILQGLFCVCRWACQLPCGAYSSRALQLEEAILVAMCPNHNTHEAQNRTATEAKDDC